MTDAKALTALSFNYTEGADDVWRPSPFHVEGLHGGSSKILLDGLAEARAQADGSPVGVVVQGQRGTGKTHLLGWLREMTQREGGYFVLVGLLDAKGFWESTVVSILDSFSRVGEDGESQLRVFLSRLASSVDVSRMTRRAVTGRKDVTREELDSFIGALRRLDEQVGRWCQDTARALVLFASADMGMQDIGEAFLYSMPEGEPGERARWGIRPVDKTPQEIVRDISRLLALTGPTVVAIDQIDPLIAQSSAATDSALSPASPVSGVVLDAGGKLLLERIAGGLMALREASRRTLTVLSCLPNSWALIQQEAVDTVRDRFREAVQLMTIPDADTARELVARRFEAQYRAAGVEPPYPTWPIRPEAFERVPGMTPRQLLIAIEAHVRSCVRDDEVRELATFDGTAVRVPSAQPTGPEALTESVAQAVIELDARFAALRDGRQPPTIDGASEDVLMPALLAAGLSAWIAAQGENGLALNVDPPPSAKPPLHARLRRILDESTEDEEHWAFRAVTANNAIAALNRIRKASVAAGLDAEVPKRRLFLLRNRDWSNGERTQEVVAAFERAGGRRLTFNGDDLRVLSALDELLAENPPHLDTWLSVRDPAGDVSFLREALTKIWSVPTTPTPPAAPAKPQDRTDDPGRAQDRTVVLPATSGPRSPFPTAGRGTAGGGQRDEGPSVPVGRRMATGAQVSVPLEALRKHTAIFAGTGSGKTVLIRRLVEECALQGVSAIVLDPNNDLARLGDPWPQPPHGWQDGDERKAADYLAGTEVVIWTPRRGAGRPLSFQPLPDFASVADDPDEFTEAVEVAVAAIAPRVKLEAKTDKAQRGQAVLRRALARYGRRGGRNLRGLIELLADLPDGVSELASAPKIAAELAQSLTAAMDNDPMFGGGGEPVDPGLLLTPSEGRRARVSVISLAGLPGEEQRQSFVGQLQMELFAWIRRHPAADRPLGGLFVMDEAQTFAPSNGRITPATRSTLALASQARKYGLGLVFATQAPKGLHNQIPGNAATQFFGLLNASAHVNTAKELARAKDGDTPDIAKLSAGEFYVALEGRSFDKVRVPMCLSHHPKAPLTTEEVIARAAR
ncbi:helicase HerA domain-containing protein [Nonomuraea sp. ZG12]|uniref:helicase HerA domain-containing protein n=1 Tax=Nonomuraea sp. ZG12 TaxID=3452207 RepID=UPI003F8C30A2